MYFFIPRNKGGKNNLNKKIIIGIIIVVMGFGLVMLFPSDDFTMATSIVNTNKQNYDLGEIVVLDFFTLRENFHSELAVFDSQNNHVLFDMCPRLAMEAPPIGPFKSGTITWDQKIWSGSDHDCRSQKKAEAGNYIIKFLGKEIPITINEVENMKKESTVEYYTEKDVFNIGEPITITAKNTSHKSLRGPATPCGFAIYDKHGNQVANFWGIATAICSFKPRDEIIKTWDGRYGNGEPVRPGLYTISGNYQGEIPKKIQLLDPTSSYDLLDNPPESEGINRLINSEIVFSGTLESKISPSSVPELFDLKFSVTENFKRAYNESIEVSVHEGAWKNCAGLKEGEDYLVFVMLDKKKLMTEKDILRCYHALELPSDVVVELREFSSHFPWWLNQ